ncbi:MAG: hypothetical protein IT480_12785 [Gammaproteobacteria bacterium]|nr:hypothetical protein [Gammaproteobacteria bacterium]
MSDAIFGLLFFGSLLSVGVAITVIAGCLWQRRPTRNRITGLRAPLPDSRDSITRFRREHGLR